MTDGWSTPVRVLSCKAVSMPTVSGLWPLPKGSVLLLTRALSCGRKKSVKSKCRHGPERVNSGRGRQHVHAVFSARSQSDVLAGVKFLTSVGMELCDECAAQEGRRQGAVQICTCVVLTGGAYAVVLLLIYGIMGSHKFRLTGSSGAQASRDTSTALTLPGSTVRRTQSALRFKAS